MKRLWEKIVKLLFSKVVIKKEEERKPERTLKVRFKIFSDRVLWEFMIGENNYVINIKGGRENDKYK